MRFRPMSGLVGCVFYLILVAPVFGPKRTRYTFFWPLPKKKGIVIVRLRMRSTYHILFIAPEPNTGTRAPFGVKNGYSLESSQNTPHEPSRDLIGQKHTSHPFLRENGPQVHLPATNYYQLSTYYTSTYPGSVWRAQVWVEPPSPHR